MWHVPETPEQTGGGHGQAGEPHRHAQAGEERRDAEGEIEDARLHLQARVSRLVSIQFCEFNYAQNWNIA